MGAWSPASFGNDDALDLLLRLENATKIEDIAQELERCFDSYADYDERRARGENFETLTAEGIEHLISHYDPNSDGIEEFFARLRTSVGTKIVDDGSHEANDAIAAAEVVCALRSGTFDRLPEDGQFLSRFETRDWAALAQSAESSLERVRLNKLLFRNSGSKWKKNLAEVQARLQCRDES